MIVSFRHKGLRRFFEEDDRRGINAEHVSKIAQILLLLNSANALEAMEVPGFRTHRLQGDLKDFHAVTVRANWRIIFRFDDGNAFDVDLVDYH